MENDNPVTAAAFIPAEIITEILLRLPVKSLLRFKCVCRPWLLLISSPKFAKTHLKTSAAQNSGVSARENLIFGLREDNDRSLYTFPIKSAIDGSVLADPLTGCLYSVDDNRDPIPLNAAPLDCPPIPRGRKLRMIGSWKLRMIGSCNGLVCFRFYILTDRGNICIMNPATRNLKILPESDVPGIYLLYYCYSYSFGYDEVHDDWKVIEVFSSDHKHGTHAMSYSSRADSWKALSWPGGGPGPGWGPGKFLNGSIHWRVVVSAARWDIVSLNLSTETFTRLPIPEDLGVCSGFNEVELEVFGGCLAIWCVNRAGIVVWVMKESWTKVVEAPFDPSEHGYFLLPWPLFVSEDARTMLLNYGSSLQLYDLGNMGPHHFGNFSKIVATTYAESLCWLTLDEEEDDEDDDDDDDDGL